MICDNYIQIKPSYEILQGRSFVKIITNHLFKKIVQMIKEQHLVMVGYMAHIIPEMVKIYINQ